MFSVKLFTADQLFKKRQYEQASKIYREIFSETQDKNIQMKLANSLRNFGWQAYYDSKYEDARKAFQEASRIYLKLTKPIEMFKIYRGIGLCESALGNNDEAIRIFTILIESLNKFKKEIKTFSVKGFNRELEKAKTMLYLSIAWAKKSSWKKALVYATIAEKYFQQFSPDERYYKALCLQGKGIAYTELGKYENAIEILKESRKIFEGLNYRYKIANIDENISTCLHRLKKYKEAIQLLDNSIETYKELGIDRASSYFARGRSYEELNQLEKAFSDFQTAINLVETRRGEIKLDIFRKTYFAEKLKVYDSAIMNCLKLGKIELAYDLVQRAKSRCFNELLEGKKDFLFKESQTFKKLEELRTEIDNEYTKINSIDKTEVNLKKLGELEFVYERTLNKLKEENIDNIETVTVTSMSVGQIKDLIDDQTAIVEYYISENNLVIFCITKNDFRHVVLKSKKEEIEQIVENLKLWVFNLDTTASENNNSIKKEAFNWYLEKISQTLFIPVENIVKNYKRIVFVPHLYLHHFPFCLLIDRNKKLLIENYETSIIATPKMLELSKRKPDASKKDITIIANPTEDLVFADTELQYITNITKNAIFFRGKDASKDKIIGKISNSSILHFACHAKIVPEKPIFSHLVLAGPSRIELNEILNMKINAELVVLSCCETGIGHIVPGDEMTCFPRAFIVAGASSVLVTLWEIDDKSTAEFMEEFYKNIFIDGNTKSAALRNAKLTMIKKGYMPYHWAGFQLIGKFL